MWARLLWSGCLLLLTQTGHAANGEEAGYLLDPEPQAKMEKCFAVPDAKPMECAVDQSSHDCIKAQKKPKDGSEFKYVPRGSCVKEGGQIFMSKKAKSEK